MEGWVKFHRKIEEWEWYTDSNTFRVFFHLVLKANHKPNKWRGIDIGKGQLITSREKLSDQLSISVQQVRTSLKKLESTKEITIKSTNRYTLVTIENWGLYQTKEEEPTNKPTNKQPTDNHQITTNKNVKKEKKTFIPPTLDEVEEYILEKQYVVDPKFFYDYFEAREWINANGKPVASWKGTIVTWNKRELTNNPGAKPYKKVEKFKGPKRRDDY